MSFNRLDIGLFTQSRPPAAPMSFRDKGPRTLRPGKKGGLASHTLDGRQTAAGRVRPSRMLSRFTPTAEPCWSEERPRYGWGVSEVVVPAGAAPTGASAWGQRRAVALGSWQEFPGRRPVA